MKKTEYSIFVDVVSQTLRSPLGLVGATIIGFSIFIAVFADFIAPYDPIQQNIAQALNGHSAAHWFGQDDLGRDILSRIIYGTRISLLVGFITIAISSIAGTVIGAVAGYFGGWVDEVIMRITDILLAFPGILLAIGIMAILGPSLNNVIIALCIVGWKSYARMVRGEVLKERGKEYIDAAKTLGYSPIRIIFIHLIPNVLNSVIVMATLGIGSMIISEAGLSFLGLGTQPPTPSWGSMLSEGRQYLLESFHLTTFPGLAIMILVLGFTLFGDAVRDALDPHIKFFKE